MSKTRILYVEDEPLIAMDTEMMLSDLGYDDVTIRNTFEQAMDTLENGSTFDLAILDMNLNGVLSAPIAERLQAESVPVLFTTGYNASGNETGAPSAPIVRKPFDAKVLKDALEDLLNGKARD